MLISLCGTLFPCVRWSFHSIFWSYRFETNQKQKFPRIEYKNSELIRSFCLKTDKWWILMWLKVSVSFFFYYRNGTYTFCLLFNQRKNKASIKPKLNLGMGTYINGIFEKIVMLLLRITIFLKELIYLYQSPQSLIHIIYVSNRFTKKERKKI